MTDSGRSSRSSSPNRGNKQDQTKIDERRDRSPSPASRSPRNENLISMGINPQEYRNTQSGDKSGSSQPDNVENRNHEIHGHMQKMIDKWGGVVEKYSKYISWGDHFLNARSQLDFEARYKALASQGNNAYDQAMDAYNEINRNNLLQNQEKMATLSKYIHDCTNSTEQLEKVVKDLSSAVKEMQEKEEGIKKSIAAIENDCYLKQRLYPRSDDNTAKEVTFIQIDKEEALYLRKNAERHHSEANESRTWFNRTVRNVENYSPTLRELRHGIESAYRDIVEELKKGPDNNNNPRLKELRQKYSDMIRDYDQNAQELHGECVPLAEKYDRTFEQFEQAIQFHRVIEASIKVVNLHKIEDDLAQKIDARWYERVTELCRKISDAHKYIRRAYHVRGVTDIVNSEQLRQTLQESSGFESQEFIRSLGQKQAFDKLQANYARCCALARGFAERLDPDRVAEFTPDQEMNEQAS
jgi:hypothetical protein